jgi:peptide/nickel transport system substrate-binding protein/microcin C transport system substrate-binding protein
LIEEGNFDGAALAWGPSDIDLDPKQVWHSANAIPGGSNFINYKNPDVDKLIDQARLELDRKKRIELLRKVYELIANDAPYAFLFNEKYASYATTAKIQKPRDTFRFAIGRDYWWAE